MTGEEYGLCQYGECEEAAVCCVRIGLGARKADLYVTVEMCKLHGEVITLESLVERT